MLEGPDVPGSAERLLLALDAGARPATIEEAQAALRDANTGDLSSINDRESFSYKDDSMYDVLAEQSREALAAGRVLARHDGAGQTLARWIETLDAEWERVGAREARARLQGLWDACPG